MGLQPRRTVIPFYKKKFEIQNDLKENVLNNKSNAHLKDGSDAVENLNLERWRNSRGWGGNLDDFTPKHGFSLRKNR